MRKLISLTLFLSFSTSFLFKLANWFSLDFTETSVKSTLMLSNETKAETSNILMSQVAIRDSFMTEGNTASDTLHFAVERSDDATSFSLNFTTVDSSATAIDHDYYPTSGSITFNAASGILTKLIKVPVFGDFKTELDEALKVQLSMNTQSLTSQVTIVDDLAVGTIINDDTSYLSIRDTMTVEGDSGTDSLRFIIDLAGALDVPFGYNFSTMDGSATVADNDYAMLNGTRSGLGSNLGTGTGSGTGIALFYGVDTISVGTKGDLKVEEDEYFKVMLSNIAAAGRNLLFANKDSLGIGAIKNDDIDISITDPCECLNNESASGVNDGQFSETVQVNALPGQTWYVVSVNGLYAPSPFSAFPPAKGGSPYGKIPFVTGVGGTQLEEVNIGLGLSHYLLKGIHQDDIGYEVTVSNGTETLSMKNTCHYDKACSADQTIVMPFYKNTKGQARIDDCKANNLFINDGIHHYADQEARQNSLTICPNIKGQTLNVAFQEFDLAAGDTLYVFEGTDTTSAFIAKASGNGVSQFNGGWVTTSCDPAINASGCLTFLFKTNGDNKKGSGWKAKVDCVVESATTLGPINDVYAKLKCDSLTIPVNLRIPSVQHGVTNCPISNDDIIISYCDVRDTLSAGTLIHPVFPFGTYRVDYKLLVDTTITASHLVHVAPPSLTCNDTVYTTIGQGCVTMIRPDHLLEDPCDYDNSAVSQLYSINVFTDSGMVVGHAPNFPILDASKDGNVQCNKFYKVAVFRSLSVTHNGCSQVLMDSCIGYVKLVDGIDPIFVDLDPDTVVACYDKTVTRDMLPTPNVIDNCEIERVDATIPPNPPGKCSPFQTIDVLWTAYDRCGNTSTATQKITIKRPNHFTSPKDTIVNEGVNIHPDVLGWPHIGFNGNHFEITTTEPYCNFEIGYKDDTIPGVCGNNLNIYRVFKLYDNCTAIPDPVYIDTQFILIRDTLSPDINCPKLGELGSLTNPHIFRTDYNTCTGLPGAIYPLSGENIQNSPTIILGVYSVPEGALVGANLNSLQPLAIGDYRVAYRLKDECGNSSEICNRYFSIKDLTKPTAICSDELIVNITYGNLIIRPEDIGNGTFDACGIDTMLIRRTICGSETVYPTDTNYYVASRFGHYLDANAWSSSIEIGCCDANTTIKVQLLVFDKNGNHNKCWLTISPEHQPQAVCGNLPDSKGYCYDYKTTYIGESTDANKNKAFDEEEWQPIEEHLVDVINNQFGNPACNAASNCTSGSIEQEYQLLIKHCGVQIMQRRFRTRSNDAANPFPWYYQNITIDYKPGWTFTFPPDTVLQCGMADAGNLPEMPLLVHNGTCDQIGWEVKDEVFETEDGSCFKIFRKWYVLNSCKHFDPNQVFSLPRDQVNGKVLSSSRRTFSSNDYIDGVNLGSEGYFTYTQVILVMDNEAPIITIADVDTCIIGVPDAEPYGQADVTPGAAPYECDTLRTFSATGLDCTANEQLDFSYELFDGNVRVTTGSGHTFSYVVQTDRTYRLRFIASDNCGNISTAERTYTFRDCKKPVVACNNYNVNLGSNQIVRVHLSDVHTYSYDNCTDTSNLELRLWHIALGTAPPTNVAEVLALPDFVDLGCTYFGGSIARVYAVDESQNYDFCNATVFVADNSNHCNFARPVISGAIQMVTGEMVDQVEVLMSGNVDMPTMVKTGTDGYFKYVVEEGANYRVEPKKDMNPLNGVSTFDLVLIQQHILGLKSFDSPYKYIAGDVNKSGSISAYDLVVLRQMILNVIQAFPNNESWRFVSMEHAMSNSSNPLVDGFHEYYDIENISTDMEVNFMAVKIGDVNGNALANNLIQSESRNTNGTLALHLKDQVVEAGKSYTIDFSVESLTEVLGYQFTLNFDDLIFEAWQGGLVKENHFGFNLANRGIITTSWNQNVKLNADKESSLFRLKFKAKSSGKLSEMLQISSDYTNAEAYNTEEELLDVQLVFEQENNQSTNFNLTQNRPNPFRDQTRINFYLPESSKTVLTIMDITGKVIKSVENYYEKGNHSISLKRSDLSTSGLLYYQLETSAGKITKTMLVLD